MSVGKGGIAHVTTARFSDGQVELAEHHLHRLLHDAALCGSDAAVCRVAVQAAQAAVVGDEGPGTMRIVVENDSFDVKKQPLRRMLWQLSDAPLALQWAPDPRQGLARQAKVADRTEYDGIPADAVFVDDGRVLEGPYAHIAFRIDGVWVTPAPGDGVLVGSMQQHLLAQPEWSAAHITVEDVERADACVMFSAHLRIAPVAKLGGRTFPRLVAM